MHLQTCGLRDHVSGGVGGVKMMLGKDAGIGRAELNHQILSVVMGHERDIHLLDSLL